MKLSEPFGAFGMATSHPGEGQGPAEQPDVFRCEEVLAGTYEVRSLLGSGGMGQVFDAVDRSLARHVAIKASWPSQHTQRLKKEAQALAAFRHSSLPSVHCLGTHEGIDFIVMERVYGVTLADHLERTLEANALLSIDEVTYLVASIADALAVVHEAGLAHFDVKLENIMLTPHRRLVMLDFGLAVPEFGLAAQARVAGTPLYMAPEVVLEFLEPGAGRLADIYSLGVMAFELFTGRLPREVHSFAELAELSPDESIDVGKQRADLPVELADLVNEMLSLDPGLRPQSAEAVGWQFRSYKDRQRRKVAVKMLVVEDDVHVARTLSFYAQRALRHVTIEVAHNGMEALESLRRWSPDVMLLDLNMPKMSGTELCMYMRGADLAGDCTVILVSAAANEQDKELLRMLGIRHFVTKDEKLSRQLSQLLSSLFGEATGSGDRTSTY